MFSMRIAAISVSLCAATSGLAQTEGINVVLNGPIDAAALAALESHGRVLDVIPELRAVMLRANATELAAIRALPCVAGASTDQKRYPAGSAQRLPDDLLDGANQWSLDAVNVTDAGIGRTIGYDGEGTYVAVIDDGFPRNWREYLPEERVAVAHARSFGGGGGEVGVVSSQPNLWEHCSRDGHGIACASIVLGFRYHGPEALPASFNGVAPRATVIPINVFNNREFYWASVIAHAIVYVADLKTSGALGNSPVVISMSNGGPEVDVVEQVAIDYAISQGIVVVVAAGNEADAGMRFPGRYGPVISVAATGASDALPANDPSLILWIENDIAENDPLSHYMAPFTAWELPGQELDVAAPGFLVPAPWAEQNGQLDYSYFGGTSAATPHVAGIAALMLQKNPALTPAQVESILESTAMPLFPDCRTVVWGFPSNGKPTTWSFFNVEMFEETFCWGANVTGHGLVQADAALAATPAQ